MQLTGTTEFRSRDFRSLSGGERQRVILASALAQTPEALLLDEPTTYLDLEHQISLYRLLRKLSREGMLVISITHDLNLASSYSDRVLVLRAGELVRDGTPAEVFRPETMRDVFRVDTPVQSGPDGRPWIHYGVQ
jgi:iron complex transport system ATP-binding protein